MNDPSIIRVRCPNLACRVILTVPAETRGKLLRCARCGGTVMVPATPRPNPVVATGDEDTEQE